MSSGPIAIHTQDRLSAFCTRLVVGATGVIGGPRLSTLIFHRVLACRDELFPDEPDVHRFDRLISFVSRSFRLMPMGDAIRALKNNNLPQRAMAITFDDGYEDNASVALPVLRRYGVAATFYVSTGFLNGGRMWNDSVIESIRASAKSDISLAAFGLGTYRLTSNVARREAILALLPVIKYMTVDEREAGIARLQHLCGVRELPTDLMMTSDQVRQLYEAGMEIGAHTVNHPILTTLSPEQAAREIRDGKESLESLIQGPVSTFAYPNGRPGADYDASHVSLVQRIGFIGAVSTSPGVAQPGDDVFQVPRYTPWGRSMALWAARLAANRRMTHFGKAEPLILTD